MLNKQPITIDAVVTNRRTGTDRNKKEYTIAEFTVMGGKIVGRNLPDHIWRTIPEEGEMVELVADIKAEMINNRVGDADYLNCYAEFLIREVNLKSHRHPAEKQSAQQPAGQRPQPVKAGN